jgi:predicted PurR-regulated permease PerM
VTLGGGLAGIVGALLAVPVAALIAVFWNYLREQLSDHEPEPEPDPVPGPDPGAAPLAQ